MTTSAPDPSSRVLVTGATGYVDFGRRGFRRGRAALARGERPQRADRP